MESHVLQVICLPQWTKIKRNDHLASKRVVDVVFALGVSLCYNDYLTEEHLKSYRLALIDKDDVSPPHTTPGPTIVTPPATKVVSSGWSAKVVPLAVAPQLEHLCAHLGFH